MENPYTSDIDSNFFYFPIFAFYKMISYFFCISDILLEKLENLRWREEGQGRVSLLSSANSIRKY